MKLEALEHPKTLDLASFLEVELPTAIGHLELLWAFVAQLTPQGNIGKYSDAVIADKARWRGKPAAFVQALVQAGFLDVDPDHRLLVHDWSEHCPNWVRAKLKKARLNFALKSSLKSGTNEPTEGVDIEASSAASSEPTSTASSRARVLPSQAKPNQDKPSAQSAREPIHVPRQTAPEERPELSASFEDFAMANCPNTSHRKNWIAAIAGARGIVGLGKATEADLRRRWLGFLAFCQSGGYSGPDKTPSPQSWFALHQQGEPYWAREWEAVPTKAQQQLDSTISAGQAFLRNSAGAA